MGIVGYSSFDRFPRKQQFKMEDAYLLQRQLQTGWWATSIDIVSTYYNVPVMAEATPLFCFCFSYCFSRSSSVYC